MNEFAQTMYLELGVQMVVLGGWMDPNGKKKWRMYISLAVLYNCHWLLIILIRFESNSFLGTNKPNFTTSEARWNEKPLEKTFHAYVKEFLTGDKEDKTVTHPASTVKPKQILPTGDKGQPLLPANCLIWHGNSTQFLNYQKQVLRAYVERIYSEWEFYYEMSL
jgi:hypothetical protein